MDELDQKQKSSSKKCNDLARKNLKLIKDTYDRLKPLHGYPKNAHLLQELDGDINEVFSLTVRDMEECFETEVVSKVFVL